MSHYLSEAFKKLDVLNEDTFAINTNGLEDFVKFEDADELEDSIDVIDTEAETIDDLQDSYVGKVILDCCVCHSKLYKDVEDVVIEDDIANANEECPFCYTTDGYRVIGQVASFDETEEKETEEKDDKIDEGLFGIKTKKEKEKEAKAKAAKEAQKQRDKELKDQEERARQQSVADSWARSDRAKRDAQREYNRSNSSSQSSKVSNTGKAGVYYSGGDYYSEELNESKSIKEDTFGYKSGNRYYGGLPNDEDIFGSTILGPKVTTPTVDMSNNDKKAIDILQREKNNSLYKIILDDVRPDNQYGGDESHVSYADGEIYWVFDIMLDNDCPTKEKALLNVKSYLSKNNISFDQNSIGVDEDDDGEDVYVFVSVPVSSLSMTANESKSIKESVNNINVETDNDIINVTPDDNGKVTVTTAPKVTSVESEEVITPIEPEVQSEINDNVEDGGEIEIDMDEFDEESFDELGEGYLKKVYENVNSFKTSNVSFIKNKLIVEGIIKFNSGKSKKTNFIFESREATKSGKVRFIGENKEIARGRKSFTVTGRVDNKKFLSESLNYNYGVRGANGKAQRLYGTVRKGN